MHSVIHDDALIQMAKRSLDRISDVADHLLRSEDETGDRLAAYVIGLRRVINLLEARISKAR